jgi:hypothetical protein
MAVLCPIALILPSRGGRGVAKSTLQNAVLGGASFWAFNQLAHDYTGKSITARSNERWGRIFGVSTSSSSSSSSAPTGSSSSSSSSDDVAAPAGKSGMFGLPPQAERNRLLMEAERKRRAEAEGREYVPKDGKGVSTGKTASLWERLWMGGEKEDWKERRLEEERRALESGRGYGDLIMQQVKEVWKGEGKGADSESGKKKD